MSVLLLYIRAIVYIYCFIISKNNQYYNKYVYDFHDQEHVKF